MLVTYLFFIFTYSHSHLHGFARFFQCFWDSFLCFFNRFQMEYSSNSLAKTARMHPPTKWFFSSKNELVGGVGFPHGWFVKCKWVFWERFFERVFERFLRGFLRDILPLSDCFVQRHTTYDLRHSRIHIHFHIHIHIHIHIVLGHGPRCIGFAFISPKCFAFAAHGFAFAAV